MLSSVDLRALKYKELQALAKANGVRANAKAVEIAVALELLRETRKMNPTSKNPDYKPIAENNDTANLLDRATATKSVDVPQPEAGGLRDEPTSGVMTTVKEAGTVKTRNARYTREELESMSYNELRKKAKAHGVCASGKFGAIVENLLRQVLASDTGDNAAVYKPTWVDDGKKVESGCEARRDTSKDHSLAVAQPRSFWDVFLFFLLALPAILGILLAADGLRGFGSVSAACGFEDIPLKNRCT